MGVSSSTEGAHHRLGQDPMGRAVFNNSAPLGGGGAGPPPPLDPPTHPPLKKSPAHGAVRQRYSRPSAPQGPRGLRGGAIRRRGRAGVRFGPVDGRGRPSGARIRGGHRLPCEKWSPPTFGTNVLSPPPAPPPQRDALKVRRVGVVHLHGPVPTALQPFGTNCPPTVW